MKIRSIFTVVVVAKQKQMLMLLAGLTTSPTAYLCPVTEQSLLAREKDSIQRQTVSQPNFNFHRQLPPKSNFVLKALVFQIQHFANDKLDVVAMPNVRKVWAHTWRPAIVVLEQFLV